MHKVFQECQWAGFIPRTSVLRTTKPLQHWERAGPSVGIPECEAQKARGKLLHLPTSQVSHLENGNRDSTQLTWAINYMWGAQKIVPEQEALDTSELLFDCGLSCCCLSLWESTTGRNKGMEQWDVEWGKRTEICTSTYATWTIKFQVEKLLRTAGQLSIVHIWPWGGTGHAFPRGSRKDFHGVKPVKRLTAAAWASFYQQ